jgi:acid phosphatase (class A)
MKISRCLAAVILALGVAAAAPAHSQRAERTPPPLDEQPQGYLRGDEIVYLAYLAPPPAEGSSEEGLDVAAVKTLQAGTTEARWAQAEADAKYLYPQFEAAFGGPIDRDHAPHLVRLLNQALRDVELPTNAGKGYFARARPFQRLQLARVCSEWAGPGPAPPLDPSDRSSYPSGHAAVGWTTALILAQVAPDNATAILTRADDYALSRVICGAHFPSDVAASRMLAAAVVAREATNPAFQRDLACAKAEHAGEASAACAPATARASRRRAPAR